MITDFANNISLVLAIITLWCWLFNYYISLKYYSLPRTQCDVEIVNINICSFWGNELTWNFLLHINCKQMEKYYFFKKAQTREQLIDQRTSIIKTLEIFSFRYTNDHFNSNCINRIGWKVRLENTSFYLII
jgi:hypothetical protein